VLCAYLNLHPGVLSSRINCVAVRHIQRPVAGWEKSYALLADCSEKETAVVFVHGFRGHSRTTWLLFQTLVDQLQASYPAWSSADLFFYSYDSFTEGVNVNAERLLRFVSAVFPVPSPTLFNLRIDRLPASVRESYKGIVLPTPDQYRRLVLVGHSMGGVVIRAAVLMSLKRSLHLAAEVGEGLKAELESRSLPNAEVRLFAPAHFGANPAGWLGVVLNIPFVGDLVRAWLCFGQAYGELGANSPLRARALWGTGDIVVTAGEYEHDYPSEYVSNVSHSDVCKPTHEYTLPLGFAVAPHLTWNVGSSN